MNREDWKAKGLALLDYLKDLSGRCVSHPDVFVAGAVVGALLLAFLR